MRVNLNYLLSSLRGRIVYIAAAAAGVSSVTKRCRRSTSKLSNIVHTINLLHKHRTLTHTKHTRCRKIERQIFLFSTSTFRCVLSGCVLRYNMCRWFGCGVVVATAHWILTAWRRAVVAMQYQQAIGVYVGPSRPTLRRSGADTARYMRALCAVLCVFWRRKGIVSDRRDHKTTHEECELSCDTSSLGEYDSGRGFLDIYVLVLYISWICNTIGNTTSLMKMRKLAWHASFYSVYNSVRYRCKLCVA